MISLLVVMFLIYTQQEQLSRSTGGFKIDEAWKRSFNPHQVKRRVRIVRGYYAELLINRSS